MFKQKAAYLQTSAVTTLSNESWVMLLAYHAFSLPWKVKNTFIRTHSEDVQG